MVNQSRPDLVAITGDFVTYEPEKFAQDLIETLRELRPVDATVAILGNHDHWTNPRLVREILAESGILDLSNRVYSLEKEGKHLHIAGVDDMLEGLDRLDLVLQKMPAEGAAVLLAHHPDYADNSSATGRFDLQLSGHTHGGQVVFPFIGPKVLPRGGRKYPNGMYQVGDMIQYTSRGVGTTPLQVRFNCSPEITLFTLRSPEKKKPSQDFEKASELEPDFPKT
jgi:predicted MPP superfamily phosphohydrolase